MNAIHEYTDAERIAQFAMDRGYCINRDEYRACRAVHRRCRRWNTAFYQQQGRRALAVLPPEGPGALAYYRAVEQPAAERRFARWVRLHGEPGDGSPND